MVSMIFIGSLIGIVILSMQASERATINRMAQESMDEDPLGQALAAAGLDSIETRLSLNRAYLTGAIDREKYDTMWSDFNAICPETDNQFCQYLEPLELDE